MARRYEIIESVTVDATLADSTEVSMAGFASGTIIVPAGETMVTVTWHVAEKSGGTFVAAYDKNNNALTTTVAASRAYPIPTELFGAAAIKMTGNVDGTAHVCLKE